MSREAKAAHRLLGDMLAKRGRLTCEQVERFIQNPDMIIPEEAVEVIRVANHIKQLTPRWHFCEPGGILLDEGHPIVLVFDLHTHHAYLFYGNMAIMELGKHENHRRSFYESKMKLLAMVDGQPLWGISAASTCSRDKVVSSLFLASRKITELPDISHVDLAPGNRLIACSSREKKGYIIQLPVDGKRLSTRKFSLKKAEDSAVTFIKEIDGIIWIGTEKNIVTQNAAYRGPGRPVDMLPNGTNCKLLVLEEKGKLFMGNFELDEGPWWHYHISPYTSLSPIPIGEVPYSHGICWLNEKRAYIGMARHQQRCWVIDGKPREAFNWVSDIFTHIEHGECYWGMTTTHLILMKI